jgi:hypothetical protein
MDESTPVKGPLTRMEQAAGYAGLLFAALFAGGLIAFNTLPDPGASESLSTWFDQHFAPRLTFVGLYIVPFAGIAFLWFMAAVRQRGGIRTDRFFDTVFLGSGFVFVAMLFGGVAVAVSTVAPHSMGSAFAPTEETIRVARLLSFAFFNIYAARAAGVFTMVTSGMLLRSERFPSWLGLIGAAVAGALLLGVSFFGYLIYLFPAWIALASTVFLVVLRPSPDGDRRPETA